jgi:hypothetical protein
VKRIVLEEKLVRLGEESAELNDLREVTDTELQSIPARQKPNLDWILYPKASGNLIESKAN